jgi:hypothetical protein
MAKFRFRIAHPTDANLYAYAGDDGVSFFVQVFRGEHNGPIESLDFSSNNNRPVGLMDCLDFLAGEGGFFDHSDIEDAICWIKWDEDRFASEAAKRIVAIIEEFGRDEPL